MKLLDLSLESPAENLALDEALLEQAEGGAQPREVLRLWESPQPIVVVGRSSRVGSEVRREACARRAVPILRRCSGGAAIVAGPGCLMYALVLSYQRRPNLRAIEQAHRFVLGTLARSLRRFVPGVEPQGTSDLTLGDRKFSGNSLRCKRTHLLYHGTLLYRFPVGLIQACLRAPPRQPDYRAARSHRQFVTNLPLDRSVLRRALIDAWHADQQLDSWPRQRTQQLAAERYADPQWNFLC